MLEHQNIRMFLQRKHSELNWISFLWLEKLKILYLGHMLLMILM